MKEWQIARRGAGIKERSSGVGQGPSRRRQGEIKPCEMHTYECMDRGKHRIRRTHGAAGEGIGGAGGGLTKKENQFQGPHADHDYDQDTTITTITTSSVNEPNELNELNGRTQARRAAGRGLRFDCSNVEGTIIKCRGTPPPPPRPQIQ